MIRILLVEDDPDIIEVITDYFQAKGAGKVVVCSAENGQRGLELVYEESFDLLLLDIMLPEMDGFMLCREIRRDNDTPIVFITARAAEEDMLRGYALGCDDYVVKPFPLPVLYEKIMALIKRAKGTVRSPALSSGGVTLDPNSGRVTSDGKEAELTAKEFAILKILLENKNKIVSREKLLLSLWGYDTDVDERIINTHIKNLRRAIGENARLIRTVRKRGYMMEEHHE